LKSFGAEDLERIRTMSKTWLVCFVEVPTRLDEEAEDLRSKFNECYANEPMPKIQKAEELRKEEGKEGRKVQ
jgi:hypothetical protein